MLSKTFVPYSAGADFTAQVALPSSYK